MTNRRSFLKSLVLGLGLLLPFRALAKKVAFKLTKAPKLEKVGGWMVLKLKGKQVLLVRDSKDSIKALSAVCTHHQCTVGYQPKSGRIECPCHFSAFGLDGRVLNGPATLPLSSYPAEIRGDRVVVTLE